MKKVNNMLCKLLPFALLISVYGNNFRVNVISDSVVLPSAPISAGKNGVSGVVQPPLRIRPPPPVYPYPPYPQPPMIDDRRKLPCPPFDLPYPPWLPIEEVEPSGSDEVTRNLIKQCHVGCWADLDNLRFSCKVIGDDKVKKWYADCIKQCYESNGKHIEIALWQGVE